MTDNTTTPDGVAAPESWTRYVAEQGLSEGEIAAALTLALEEVGPEQSYKLWDQAGRPGSAVPLNPMQIVWAWWGQTIAAAVEGDKESQVQLSEATGSPFAHEVFSRIDEREADPAAIWTGLLADAAADPDKFAALPADGEPGWDPILGPAFKLAGQIVRGAVGGNPACLPRADAGAGAADEVQP